MKILAAILIMGLFIVSCDINYEDSVSGNGKVITLQVNTDTIRQIIVSDKLDVTLVPSDSVKVLLKADENLHDVIKITAENGILRVSSSKYIRIARSKEVIVYGRTINKVEASLRATVITRDTISCDDFILNTSSGTDAKISGHFKSCTVNSRSGSSVNLEGKTDYLNINASSASDIFGYNFEAIRADVIASSASNVQISILGEAHLNASSAADIKYKGVPRLMDSKSSSLGEIRQARF